MAYDTSGKLLLTNDNELINTVKNRFQELEYNLVQASDVNETAKHLENLYFDIALIDINFYFTPSGDGERLFSILEEHSVPSIILYNPAETFKLKQMDGIPSFGYIAYYSDSAVYDAAIKGALSLTGMGKQILLSNVEQELEKTRLMLSDVLDTIPVRVFWKDLNSVYLGCNRLFAMDSGKSRPEDIVGLTDFDIRDRERAELNRQDDMNIIAAGKPRINYEELFLTVDGRTDWINTSKVPLYNREGQMYGILGMYENITGRKLMEEELKLQKNRLTNIVYGSNAGTWEWNLRTGENIINESWATTLGYTIEELPTDTPNFWKLFIHPEDLPIVESLLEKHIRGESELFECELRLHHKDGSWVWVLSRGKIASRGLDGKPLLISGVHVDVNQRKIAQQELSKQLSEKETILKEAHHRIKNNFASACSLLSLQAESVVSDEAKTALKEAEGMIHSLQVLYEKLLLVDDYSDTSVKNYLDDLIDDIIHIYHENSYIIVEKQISDCSLTPRQLFPLGIIINELITNSVKYAFDDPDNGIIRIKLEEKGGVVTLIIHDNGKGLPPGYDPDKKHGFGLMLVKAFCQQLNGTFNITNSEGTKAVLTFEISD